MQWRSESSTLLHDEAEVRIVLMVAEPRDESSAFVAETVARRAPELRAIVLSPGELALARWRHELSTRGQSSTRLTLHGSQRFEADDIAAAWCRTPTVFAPHHARARPGDREYAAAELHALTSSWLESLGSRVPGRVHPPPRQPDPLDHGRTLRLVEQRGARPGIRAGLLPLPYNLL